jgi:hypothetical protein
MKKTTEQLQREFFLRQSGPQTSHGLHVLLSLLTVGFWLPIWALVALSNSIERNKLVKQDAKEQEAEIPSPPPSTKAVARGRALGLYIAGITAKGSK